MANTKGKRNPVSIFVSSTYKDLSRYRDEVEKRLVSLEQAVKGMEYFGASSDTPLEVCKKKLSECKLMILLVGVSYGSIEPTSGKSYTENEYDYACELDIPILCYFADTSSGKLEIPIDAVDSANSTRLAEFKKRVSSSRVIATFTSIEDLGEKILHDVPEELEKLQIISNNTSMSMNDKAEIDESSLHDGARQYERFWLRPQKLAGKLVPLRIRLNQEFSGWKVKDELIRALGLTVGDTISTEVTVLLSDGIIKDYGDTDLFADGDAADWLLDQVEQAKTVRGCIVDCYVRFNYCRAPVGENSKIVNKASLILVSGLSLYGVDQNYILSSQSNTLEAFGPLSRLLAGLD